MNIFPSDHNKNKNIGYANWNCSEQQP